MTMLAVAALSARMLAEVATDEGFGVVALDLFGDADTRRACSQWIPIGDAGSLRIDAARLMSALADLARRGCVAGWIAGSGFEGRSELLERGAALLPLIGTPAAAVRHVRDPRSFFALLDAQGIAHPPVRMAAPEPADGWLDKDAHGCGGRHIRRLSGHGGAAASNGSGASGRRYFQREIPGTPMSATFIANGEDAVVLGFNQLIVRNVGALPFVYCGAIGPVPLPGATARRVVDAVRRSAGAFSLRGLGSLDFMRSDDTFSVLEVNPRPPASVELYRDRAGVAGSRPAARGVVAAHVRACQHGELPHWAPAPGGPAVTGTQIVFAPRPVWLDDGDVRRLAALASCHDLPAAAGRFEAGDPVCSVSAHADSAAQVRALLERECENVHRSLETCS